MLVGIEVSWVNPVPISAYVVFLLFSIYFLWYIFGRICFHNQDVLSSVVIISIFCLTFMCEQLNGKYHANLISFQKPQMFVF